MWISRLSDRAILGTGLFSPQYKKVIKSLIYLKISAEISMFEIPQDLVFTKVLLMFSSHVLGPLSTKVVVYGCWLRGFKMSFLMCTGQATLMLYIIEKNPTIIDGQNVLKLTGSLEQHMSIDYNYLEPSRNPLVRVILKISQLKKDTYTAIEFSLFCGRQISYWVLSH